MHAQLGKQEIAAMFGQTLDQVEARYAPRERREAEGWELDRDHAPARLLWGSGPLPHRSTLEGAIRRPDGRRGALVRIHDTNRYVVGNAGVLTSVDQRAVKDLLGRD